MTRRPYNQQVRAEKTAQTRARILEVTNRQLRKADQLWVREIADAAGVSVQTLYSHFGSRVGLLAALIGYVAERLGFYEEIQRVWDSRDGESALRAMLDLTFHFWHGYREFLEFSLRARRSDPELEAHFRRLDDSRLHDLVVICRRLREERRLPRGLSPERAARLLFAQSSPYVYEELVMKGGMPVNQATRLVRQAALNSVLRAGSRPLKSSEIDWARLGLRPPAT